MLKVSFANSQMVLGSLLMGCLLISGCASNPHTGDNTAFSSSPNFGAWVVPRQDRDQHEQCVYFALDNLFLGEKCDWYSSRGSARGRVEIVAHRQQGSGYCTSLFNSVFHGNIWRNWQQTACKQSNGQWRFVSR